MEEAYLIARGPNPFASICGRVCGAPCEAACRRGKVPRVDDDGRFVAADRPIAIRALKRFVCDRIRARGAGRARRDAATRARLRTRSSAATPRRWPALLRAAVNGRHRTRDRTARGDRRRRARRPLGGAHDLALMGFQPVVFETEPVAGRHAHRRRPRLSPAARPDRARGGGDRGAGGRDPLRRHRGPGRRLRRASARLRGGDHRRRRQGVARPGLAGRTGPAGLWRRRSPARRGAGRAASTLGQRGRGDRRRQRRLRRGPHRGAPDRLSTPPAPRPACRASPGAPGLAGDPGGDARRHARDPRGRRGGRATPQRLGPAGDRARRAGRRRRVSRSAAACGSSTSRRRFAPVFDDADAAAVALRHRAALRRPGARPALPRRRGRRHRAVPPGWPKVDPETLVTTRRRTFSSPAIWPTARGC